MSSNQQRTPAFRHSYVQLGTEFAAFDALPRELRQFLNECPLGLSAADVYENLLAGVSPAQVLSDLEDEMSVKMITVCIDAYGPTHPMLGFNA